MRLILSRVQTTGWSELKASEIVGKKNFGIFFTSITFPFTREELIPREKSYKKNIILPYWTIPSNLKMKSKFLVTISFIFLVNTSNAQQSSVSHANLSGAGIYGLVKPEVLWTIARRLHFDLSISRYQIRLARFKLNLHAFQKPGNINTLKTGAISPIPSLKIINAIDHPYAIQEIEK